MQAINKYLSSGNKLLHTCKDQLKVRTKLWKIVRWSNLLIFCSNEAVLAQIEQSYLVLVQKVPVLDQNAKLKQA